MTHDRLVPIVEAICFACDYGEQSSMKAQELLSKLQPLNPTLSHDDAVTAMYAIIHTALKILEEIECTSVTNVNESSNQNQDLVDTANHVMLNQKKK